MASWTTTTRTASWMATRRAAAACRCLLPPSPLVPAVDATACGLASAAARAMAVDAAARALAIDGAALACSTTRSTLPVRLEMLEGRGEEGKGEVQGSTDDSEQRSAPPVRRAPHAPGGATASACRWLNGN
uniref:Uncharacterized protein n=1 Tax=Oryza rufipogon TaxID=4529 RepID=A0A0E0PS85_ORYRU